MPAEIAKDFRETSTALRNWWEQIFAWYDYPVSNAYTESVNRLAKDLNRMGRMVASSFSLADLGFDEPEKVVEYGPHIPTLCRLLEAGHFD